MVPIVDHAMPDRVVQAIGITDGVGIATISIKDEGGITEEGGSTDGGWGVTKEGVSASQMSPVHAF